MRVTSESTFPLTIRVAMTIRSNVNVIIIIIIIIQLSVTNVLADQQYDKFHRHYRNITKIRNITNNKRKHTGKK